MAAWVTPVYDLDGGGGQVLFTPHILGGGIGGVNIVRGDVQSENFVPGSVGWRIRSDGSVEFNDTIIRGGLSSEDYVPGVSGWALFDSGGIEVNDITVRAGIVPGSAITAATITGAQLDVIDINASRYVGSPNFVAGVSGWRINGDGTVEFNSGIFRGDLEAGEIHIPETTEVGLHVDGAGDLWIGGDSTEKATAPFRVDAATGNVVMNDGQIGGDVTVAIGGRIDIISNLTDVVARFNQAGLFWLEGGDSVGGLRYSTVGSGSMVLSAESSLFFSADENILLGDLAAPSDLVRIWGNQVSIGATTGLGGIINVTGTLARGVLERGVNTGDSGATTAVVVVTADGAVTLAANRMYRVTAQFAMTVTNAGDRWDGTIRDTGSNIYGDTTILWHANANGFTARVESIFKGDGTTKTLRCQVNPRGSVAGTFAIFGSSEPSVLTIEDIGHAPS